MGRKIVHSFFESEGTPGRPCSNTIFSIALVLATLLFHPLSSHASENSLEKDLQKSLQQSKALLAAIQTKMQAGSPISSEIAKLKAGAESIRTSNLLLEERFKIREEKAKSLGSKATARHQAMAEGYRAALTEYLKLVDGLLSAGSQESGVGSQEKIDNLKKLLDRTVSKKKKPIIGSLPYKHLNYPAQKPSTAAPITPAYKKDGNQAVSPDDTATTEEAPLSHEIAALAQSLGWSPVSIYEYVKNNVETEWYWGCMKGAEDTLHQKSGNDCDQATLLTALLRASGYPTRYVRGTIQFFPGIEQAKNLTGIDDPTKIADFLQKAKVPYTPVIQGGAITNFQFEHIWVESQVPYANYRGAVIDVNGKIWLGLDTSLKVKGYTYNSAPDILSAMSLSTTRDEYLGLATATTPSTPFELNQTPLEYLKSSVNAALSVSKPTATYSDYLRTKTIIPEVLNILPASMQFTQIKTTNEYTTLPDELLHQVKLSAISAQASANTDKLFDITLPLYKLSNQQIVLSYEPETVEDQAIIDSYGGLGSTPAYLVRLRPMLEINGERMIVAKDGLPMGGEFDLTVELIGAGGTEVASSESRVERITNTHIIGNLTVIGIVAGQASLAPSPLAGEGGGEGEKDAERLLYESAQHYIDRWNKAENELAALLHVSLARPLPTVAILGNVIDVTYLLDTPHGFTWKGVYVDAGFRSIEVVTGYGFRVTGEDQKQMLFMQLSSLQGSVLENRIFEDDFKVESISTAKLFQLATRNPQPGTSLLTLDKTNIDAILPMLSFDDNIKEDIINSVNQNFAIRIPQSAIVYQDWSGLGFLKENPDTGESGWMLSGSIAGGMTAWDIDKWNAVLAATLSNPYSEPANYDPASAQYIEKITASDMQNGTVGTKLDEPLQVRVTDAKHNAVAGASVTFTIKAGGGTFDKLATSVTALTDGKGIASAVPILGKYTKDNPTFVDEDGGAYYTQAGENLIDAALPSGTNLTAPFTALGLPDEASLRIKPLHGDGTYGSLFSFAGFVSVSVEDQYANPISNIPVVFTSTKIDNPQCSADTSENYASLVSTGATCLKQSPTWGDCGDVKSTLTVTSSNTGAAVEVILGSIPGATYPITANAGTSGVTFNLHTNPFGNCTGTKEPSNTLMLMSVELDDQYGNNINAGKTGSILPLSAKMYYVREGEKIDSETLSCSAGPLTCPRIVGNTIYITDTSFTSASMTFGNATGTDQGNGIYKADYQLQPGKNTITINATAAIKINKSQNSCSGCSTNPNYTLTNTGTATMTVYGVTVKTPAIPMLLVNESGYLANDQVITYTIEPLSSDYNAMSAYTFLYKDGNIVSQISVTTKGTGTATISRGFKFDVNSKYEAEVVLNYGTGVEIKSDRVNIPVAQLSVLTDESPAQSADEIKFSDGSDHSNGTKKYHIAIQSQTLLSSCESLTGRIVTLSTTTATLGQPVSTPGFDYAAGYTLSFNHPWLPLGNKLCNVQIVDMLDNGSKKDKFILSNRPRTALDVGLPHSNIYNTAVLYGGIGNKFWVEVGGVGKAISTEPVGVLILGIDGLRQDVLYDNYDASYSDPFGCGGDTCYVRVDDTNLPGLSQIMTSTGTIKLKDVTTIFPSITFAAWASIYTGLMPSATGITGNEFFARDLYNSGTTNNQAIPGMDTLPSGMVTLDADGGAMRATPSGGTLSILLGKVNDSAPFVLNSVMPAEFLGYDTLSKKLASSAPGKSLQSVPLWKSINDMVAGKYQINTSDRCDQKSANECRTVSMFNQYVAGADWWGTPSDTWKTLWKATWEGSLFDSASTNETVDFISNYFGQPATNGKRKRFPVLFSVYLPGLDHDAHINGMGHYKTFVKDTVDAKVSQIVSALKGQDEFDNKIFIIVSDHGHTAMPTDLKFKMPVKNVDPIDGGAYTTVEDFDAEMSCKLKVDFSDPDDSDNASLKKEAELNNNSLHIWELAEVFKKLSENMDYGLWSQTSGTTAAEDLYILTPAAIANLYKDTDPVTSDIGEANVIAAFNGPMAHIYVKASNDWSDETPDFANVENVAEIFRLIFQTNNQQEAAAQLGLTMVGYYRIRAIVSRLNASIDTVLIRQNGSYKIFNGKGVIPGNLSFNGEYVDAINRIPSMNHQTRSGDIILIMKDATTGVAADRYTTAYACKSWHGSLNPSDSYVPFIVSYPGGNKDILDTITQKVCSSSACSGNWMLKDFVTEVINKQYSGQ